MMLLYGWLIDYHSIPPSVLSQDCYGSFSQGFLGTRMLYFEWHIDYHSIWPMVLFFDCYGSFSRGFLGTIPCDSSLITPNDVVVLAANWLPFHPNFDVVSRLLWILQSEMSWNNSLDSGLTNPDDVLVRVTNWLRFHLTYLNKSQQCCSMGS